jgi:hypothetical protein
LLKRAYWKNKPIVSRQETLSTLGSSGGDAAYEIVPNRSVFGAGLAVPMWKLWPLSSEDKRCDGYFKVRKSLLVLEIVPLPNKRWFACGPFTNIT